MGAVTSVRSDMVYVDRETSRRFDRMCMELGYRRTPAALGVGPATALALREQGRVQRDAYQRALARLEQWEGGRGHSV